ncbi:MAG: hypothetical protein A3F18_04195 [Legionellales bacterium RIFCSPHIGHO2_12_FULL_37_14]|nr:MAG: hypothetical protein A3F18_04195 [Legionellales bacterium RIFCSPHIGHO2_12_FULL_37_14]
MVILLFLLYLNNLQKLKPASYLLQKLNFTFWILSINMHRVFKQARQVKFIITNITILINNLQ